MRIVHFIENYLQLTETFVYNYIKKSLEYGDVIVVTFGILNEDQFPLPGTIEIYKLKKDPVFARKDIRRWPWMLIRKLSGKKIWYSQLKKIMVDFKPDLVHCHFGVTGVYLTDFIRFEKMEIPFITNFYGYDASELPQRDKQYAGGLSRLWESSHLLVAEAPVMGCRLKGLGAPADKIRVSPIIVDGRKYPKKEIYPINKSKQVDFLLIGRFVDKKGFHLFLEAIGKIKDDIPPFRVIIIGDGPLFNLYESIIERYQMQDRVSFLGMKPLSECINYLLVADVLVQTSVTAANGDSEGGAPTIIIEAQMVGIPVIGSTHADIPFVMGYDDFLAKEGDVEDISRVIKSFFTCESIPEKIEAGRRKASEQHDMNISKDYRDMLLEFSR